MKKFWNWIHDDGGGRTLRLEGPIDSDSFWGDEVTPKLFRDELESGEGDVTVWINSPGGDVFAAGEIYTMLREYAGAVTVKIASIAASAASVVAMAGDTVLMSPTAMLMIHDPSTIAMGNARDMEKAAETLNEVKESIVNAYAAKTGLSRRKISELMENETWINAKKAVELGFADAILFEAKQEPEAPEEDDTIAANGAQLFSCRRMDLAVMNRLGIELRAAEPEPEAAPEPEPEPAPVEQEPKAPVIGMDGRTEDGSVPYQILMDKLMLLR